MRLRFLLGLMILLSWSILRAQEVFIEHQSDATEFIVALPHKSLMFEKKDGIAEYQVSLEIKDKAKKQVSKLEQTLRVHNNPLLASTAIAIKHRVVLAAGDYHLSVVVRNPKLGDKRNSSRMFEVGIRSNDIGQAYLMGELDEVFYLLNSLDQIDGVFERVFLSQNISIPLDSLQVKYRDQDLWYHDLHNANELDLGAKLRYNRDSKMEIRYFEGNIRYYTEPYLFGALQSYDFSYSNKDQIEQLRYIATQNEWNALRRLDSDIQKDAIEKFWSKHDPSPGTIRNEARDAFNKRVLIADERFSIHARLKGWRSDRGRIYIKFGDPDDEISEVHPVDDPPNIIWQYYKHNKKFIFADYKGYGQYELVNKDEEYDE